MYFVVVVCFVFCSVYGFGVCGCCALRCCLLGLQFLCLVLAGCAAFGFGVLRLMFVLGGFGMGWRGNLVWVCV